MPERDLSVMNHVRLADLEALERSLAAWGFHRVDLHGEAVTDRASLFAALTRDLPNGAECAPGNWSSFEDCVTSMVFELERPKVALVWQGAHRMLEGGLPDFMTAADILTSISRVAYAQDITFVTCLVGDGPNFPRWPEQD